MALLNRDQILAAVDRKFVEVDVPEWGGKVRLGTMTAAARDRYETSFLAFRKGDLDVSVRAALVAACAVDEKDAPLFTQEDVVALGAKSGTALLRLFNAAADLNVLSDKAEEKQASD